ncbi:MAG: hypothetical protein A3K76_01495 [Euryarchaeota archaeon RBG_13_57_23]|nr:MAG: hypothetical protein A3K76_01495 [Euryarchaeota archaeon RBG_13_57_23]
MTIWEQTTNITVHVFQMSEVMSTGVSFFTAATVSEIYSVTSDGTYLTIYCYKVPPEPMTGIGTGNNIVAVRLDGVLEHPEGLYASTIVSYVVGVGGVEESRWNALGPETQVGPYMDLPYTAMGDYGSELVLAFMYVDVEQIDATLDFDPDTVNPKSNGKWVTCYIELPEGYDPEDIDLSSVMLNEAVPADLSHVAAYGDADGDDIADVMLKFDREAVQNTLMPGESVQVEVSGVLEDGIVFSGTDTITVLDKN